MTSPLSTDVVIVGAGMAGLTLAAALARQGMKVTLLEKYDVGYFSAHPEITPPPDGRSSAIAYASQQILDRFGLWEGVLAAEACPINDIHITDGNTPFSLHFDHRQVGEMPMGYMLENRAILRALFNVAVTLPAITLLSPAHAVQITHDAHHAVVHLHDGRAIRARLVVAADGKTSTVRQMLNIPTTRWDYGQTAIVCTIAHEKHHQYVAQERFLPSGPFAVLPLKGGYHSSLVWVEKTPLIAQFMQMEESERLWHIQKRVGMSLGRVEPVTHFTSYPLNACFAERYAEGRAVLVGDAAHGIHPIAGQGFNLGVQDSGVLVDEVLAQYQLGLDIGAKHVLARYTSKRRPENMAMLAITDGLTRLFSTNFSSIKHARRLGIGAVDHIAPLQRFFIRYAMGLRGK